MAAFEIWEDEAMRTAHRAAASDGLKDLVQSATVGEVLAVRDRNEHDGNWRQVFLHQESEDTWKLHDDFGETIDEPDDGCPETGFTTESVLSDVGMDFYALSEEMDEEVDTEPPKGAVSVTSLSRAPSVRPRV